jgi:hypothetical protein
MTVQEYRALLFRIFDLFDQVEKTYLKHKTHTPLGKDLSQPLANLSLELFVAKREMEGE